MAWLLIGFGAAVFLLGLILVVPIRFLGGQGEGEKDVADWGDSDMASLEAQRRDLYVERCVGIAMVVLGVGAVAGGVWLGPS